MKSKKYIEPQYLYDSKNKPTDVYLNIEDFEALMKKFEKFAKKPKVELKTKKSSR